MGTYWKKRKKSYIDDLEALDYTPLSIPVGCQTPETTNEAIARILYHSGQIDIDAYNTMRGMEFDMDYDAEEDFDYPDSPDYEDEMVQSVFAKYEDEIDEIATPAPKASANAVNPRAQVSPDSTSQSGDVTVTEGNKDESKDKSLDS